MHSLYLLNSSSHTNALQEPLAAAIVNAMQQNGLILLQSNSRPVSEWMLQQFVAFSCPGKHVQPVTIAASEDSKATLLPMDSGFAASLLDGNPVGIKSETEAVTETSGRAVYRHLLQVM